MKRNARPPRNGTTRVWMIVAIPAFVAGLCVVAASVQNAEVGEANSAPTLENRREISQHGVTWELDKDVPVGQFVNGDCYVVGPVTVVSIDPAPVDGRNGSVLNL